MIIWTSFTFDCRGKSKTINRGSTRSGTSCFSWFWSHFFSSLSSGELILEKNFHKTLILAFEANSALSCQNGLFFLVLAHCAWWSSSCPLGSLWTAFINYHALQRETINENRSVFCLLLALVLWFNGMVCSKLLVDNKFRCRSHYLTVKG